MLVSLASREAEDVVQSKILNSLNRRRALRARCNHQSMAGGTLSRSQMRTPARALLQNPAPKSHSHVSDVRGTENPIATLLSHYTSRPSHVSRSISVNAVPALPLSTSPRDTSSRQAARTRAALVGAKLNPGSLSRGSHSGPRSHSRYAPSDVLLPCQPLGG